MGVWSEQYQLGNLFIFKPHSAYYNYLIRKAKIFEMQSTPSDSPCFIYATYPITNSTITYFPLYSLYFSSSNSQLQLPSFYLCPSPTEAQITTYQPLHPRLSPNRNLDENRDGIDSVSIIQNGRNRQTSLQALSSPPQASISPPEDNLTNEKPSSSGGASNSRRGQVATAKRGKLRQQDQEYNPGKSKSRAKKTKYTKKEEKNIMTNQINQILSFIQKQNKSGRIVARIFHKYPHPPSCSLKRYYIYQKLLSSKLQNYIDWKALSQINELCEPKCEIWPEQDQRFYIKISRILIHHYLHEDSIFVILTSKRMACERKKAHIRSLRVVRECVLEMVKG